MMRGSVLGAIALLIAATFCSLNVAIAAVGRTPATFDVDQSGAAHYVIPIDAPPGTAGLTPRLALVYDHRNQASLAGIGWSITGLSVITRCNSTWGEDSVARDVRNDVTDRFCLDGNKLRLTGGTYGSAGATYQTQLETFARVTSYGVAGNGPASFVVERKNGLIYEYGNTEDSRIQSVGQATVRAWAVNKIRDRSNNAIVFTYAEDTVNGSYRIDSIAYTSNPSAAAAWTIDFVWETKPSSEIDTSYVAGSVIKEITRLDRIDVLNSSLAVRRRYELTYEGALSSMYRSRLASVQECAGSPLDCLPAITFSYQNGTVGLSAATNAGFVVPAFTRPWPIDVNGDGRRDLVYPSSTTSGSGTWMVAFANSSGSYNAPINTGITNTNWIGAVVIDYNADGLADLLVPYSGGTWWVILGTTSGLSAPFNTGIAATGTGPAARAIDINGDGLEDLVWADYVGYAGGDAIRYRLRELSGTFSTIVTTLVGPMPPNEILENVFGNSGQFFSDRVPDFNGDGRGDIVYTDTSREFIDGPNIWQYTRSLVAICPGGMTFGAVLTAGTGSANWGDFNGDGRTDLLYFKGGTTSSTVVRFSRGTSFSAEISPLNTNYTTPYIVLDWDGDGYDDFLVRNSTTNVFDVLRSTGEGFAARASTGISASGSDLTVTDVDGSGLMDFAYVTASSWMYHTHPGVRPDLLLSATDGYGMSVSFAYTPLTSSSYSRQSGAVFPQQDIQSSMLVVASLTASNGIGSTYTQTFNYTGARRNLQRSTFDGFYSQQVQDNRNGLYTYKYFYRDFPLTGLVQQLDEVQANNSTLMKRTVNTATYATYGSGFQTRYLPYFSQTSTTDYEVGGTYNGQALRTTVRQNVLDTATGTIYDTTVTTTEPSSANGVQSGASYVQHVSMPTALFTNDWTNWCFGQPNQIQETRSHNLYGGGALTRTTNLTWDSLKCRVTQQVSEPGNSLLQVTRTLGYDAFGNVGSDSTVGIGMTARTTTLD